MNDPRLCQIIEYNHNATLSDVTIIGFTSDLGCVENGGRAGSRDGYHNIINILPNIGTLKNPELNIDISNLSINSIGHVNSHKDLEVLVSEVSGVSIPIIIGGSNDQSFPNALGLLQNYPNLDVVNIDAHLDVRPGKGHSGSPFQELLNHPNFKGNFDEFASQGNQCSAIHAQFVLDKGGNITWLKDIKENSFFNLLKKNNNPLFVSFDIDAIRASDCPGVSCPSTRGLTAEQALDICFLAGKSSRVVGLDLSEFNPEIENNITPRLVCQMIYYFLLGFSLRF